MEALKMAEDGTIEGWLAPYGGPQALGGKDLHGEWFSERTDFALGWFKDWDRPLLYGHGLDDTIKAEVVGRIKVEARDGGLWMRAQLDAAHAYHADIAALVSEGALGASSGSVAHLVQRDRKSGEILRWPLVEGSLTPTPANPDATVGYAAKSADVLAHLAAVGTEAPEGVSPDPDAAILSAVKEGRRHSANDAGHIQSAHDVMVALGAACAIPEGDPAPATASKDAAAAPAPGPAATPSLAIKAPEPVANADLGAMRELLSSHAIKVARELLR